MSNTTKRIEGAAEQVGGTIKKAVGSLIGNQQMKAEGEVAELKGKTKQEAVKAAERVQGVVEEVGGALKHGAGEVLGNDQMAAEGMAKKLKGQARQKLNK